jgi:hypothetical protein
MCWFIGRNKTEIETTEEQRRHNSRLARLRILWEIHVYVSQEILSLTENNRLRSSQPRQAAKRCMLCGQKY